ncbi:MAG: filamentous hemagglutinin N-terminal domain-containing protein [Phycisphaerae bacterium]|nr:filamentous hemagglutinin N-terminal domain-containing protein [Phycisphaerae bacterium]
MKKMMKSSTRQLLRTTIACLTAFLIINGPVWAISETDVLNKINTEVNTSGNTTTVDVLGNRSIIDWSNFNTDNGEVLEFIRDGGANFAVLNRILSGSQTQFDGKLLGNQGHIIVINQHGIVFGPTAEVSAHRFTASTLGLDMTDADFLDGSENFAFKTGDARGRISLAAGAEITADQIELLAHQISNSGLVVGSGNIVLLATGDEIYLASESDDIVVEIATPNVNGFNYTITNEAAGTIQNDTGKVVLAAGDTFAQALTGIQNLAYAVGDYNVEQRGSIQAAELEAGAAQQIALRPGGSTAADTVKLAAQKVELRHALDIPGDLTVDSDYHITATDNLHSGGDMSLTGHLSSVVLQGQAASDGAMTVDAGTNILMLQGASSQDAMTLTAGNLIVTYANLESQANITATAAETRSNADILAADDLTVNSDLILFGSADQTVASETANVHAAGKISKSTDGSIYIAAQNNVRLDGDITADLGGVSVIAETGTIHTGEGDALNIAISGYSDDVWDNTGADLPYKGSEGESLSKAAIVLQSGQDLTIGPDAKLNAEGRYVAPEEVSGEFPYGVDDRPAVNFLAQDALIGGYVRDKGVPSDIAIYAASTEGNVTVQTPAIYVSNNVKAGDATVVFDAYDTVSMPFLADVVATSEIEFGGFRLEVASRQCEWLEDAINGGKLPFADNPEAIEAVLGEGNYVLRGAGQNNSSISDGRQWVLENPKAFAAPLAVLEIPELMGCPVEMQAAAIELGISDDTLQMTIRNSLAMNPNIQPCDACASLVTAATILNDADGVRLAAMNQIFNTLAPADAPFTPEVSASVVTAFAQLGDQDRQYALAAEYIDAFARYVAILDTELKAPIGDPVVFALEKHGDTLMGEQANPNIAAYILSQVMPEGI